MSARSGLEAGSHSGTSVHGRTPWARAKSPSTHHGVRRRAGEDGVEQGLRGGARPGQVDHAGQPLAMACRRKRATSVASMSWIG